MKRSNGRRIPSTRRRGVVAVFAMVMLVVLIGFASLTLDVGVLYNTRADLQHAADASALAAARDLAEKSTAVAAAKDFAKRNSGGSAKVLLDSDVLLGHWNKKSAVFTDGGTPLNAVHVLTRRSSANGNPVELFFAGIFGITQANVSASATAMTGRVISTFPLALRRPEVGPVKPALPIPLIGPSKPANGAYFTVGEQVVIGYNGNLQWPTQQNWTQVSITLLEGSVSVAKKIVDGTYQLQGAAVLEMTDEEYFTSEPIQNDWIDWAKKRTTYPNHPELRDIVMPVITELPNSRDPQTQLLNGKVEIVDAVAVHIVGWQWENVTNTVTHKSGKAQALVGTVTGITNKFAPSGTDLGPTPIPAKPPQLVQ